MLKKLKLLKKPLFQKRRWSCDFPPRKDGILCPRRVVLGLPSPSHRVCGRTDVRMYGCTVVWTGGHVTITSQPKFLGLIGYHISLAMELRWRALPAGFAINLREMKTNHCYFCPIPIFRAHSVLFFRMTKAVKSIILQCSNDLSSFVLNLYYFYAKLEEWMPVTSLYIYLFNNYPAKSR